ncbi:MAG: MetQ/NlpA family ABC transporter substrate-binding protein [Coriobacteriales bacterium]|nr:MetQ/NlpA family ABC transporter substrate-binding protein [Coriobacteriales bacterium]
MNRAKGKGFLKLLAVAAIACMAALAIAGCGSNNADPEDPNIKVGASPAPHAEILAQVKDDLADQGYNLEIVEYSDYIQPNVALNDGELDANYFQHLPYLEDYNAENGTELVSAAAIHFEPLCIYPGKTKSLDALADGAKIAVPSDTTNEARALQLLQAQGLIKLADGAGLNATKNDIVDNPKNIDIVEVEAANLPRTLEDVDMAVINGNFAISAGIDTDTALASEDSESEAAQTFANIIAVRAGDEDSPKIQALVKAVQSQKVKDFITDTYAGAVIPMF